MPALPRTATTNIALATAALAHTIVASTASATITHSTAALTTAAHSSAKNMTAAFAAIITATNNTAFATNFITSVTIAGAASATVTAAITATAPASPSPTSSAFAPLRPRRRRPRRQGGVLETADRQKLDKFLRTLTNLPDCEHSANVEVKIVMVNKSYPWVSWGALIPRWAFTEQPDQLGKQFASLLIPTIDSVAASTTWASPSRFAKQPCAPRVPPTLLMPPPPTTS
jgi:hypothetical protein